MDLSTIDESNLNIENIEETSGATGVSIGKATDRTFLFNDVINLDFKIPDADGTFEFPSFKGIKTVYIGSFRNRRMEGNGKLLYSNKWTYIGQLQNNYRNGQGVLISPSFTATGNWTNGVLEGEATVEYSSGTFQGIVRNNMRLKGAYKYKSGAVYKGEWKNNKKSGSGVLDFGDERYEGEFLNDKYHGNGIYWYKNGEYYKGSWKEGLRDGKGLFHYKYACYDGEWKNGRKHGKGIYINGKLEIEGVWEMDRLVSGNCPISEESELFGCPNLLTFLVTKQPLEDCSVLIYHTRNIKEFSIKTLWDIWSILYGLVDLYELNVSVGQQYKRINSPMIHRYERPHDANTTLCLREVLEYLIEASTKLSMKTNIESAFEGISAKLDILIQSILKKRKANNSNNSSAIKREEWILEFKSESEDEDYISLNKAIVILINSTNHSAKTITDIIKNKTSLGEDLSINLCLYDYCYIRSQIASYSKDE